MKDDTSTLKPIRILASALHILRVPEESFSAIYVISQTVIGWVRLTLLKREYQTAE